MRWNKPVTLLLSIALLLAMTVGAVAKEGIDKKGVVSKTTGASSVLLDVNQIECYLTNDGSFGENPQTGGDGFYFPRGQRTLSIIYTAGLWICGYINGEARSAVNCYGSEFQPGIINPDGTPADPLDDAYVMYKYNAGDVVDAEAIAQGCPEEVLGDQMAFCVYNDLKSHASMWGAPPIGIEVRQTAFAFNRTGALGQTIFLQWDFENKGTDDLDSAYVGVFFDPDLGHANDDLVGCDTTLGIAFVYNGDGYDEKYGVEVPALASDFFQGPLVPAPGESAHLPDGTVVPDSKILPMTAFFCYINGSPISGMVDPHTPQEGWYFMAGYRGNGMPWMDPVAGETKFPFAGDPVSETGWLLKHITQPDDMRMGNASGPFDLEVGDVQKVVVGLVVGQGTDNLSSVTVMKFYDRAAQLAYDMNFELPSPPPQPMLNVAQLDNELVLTWDGAAANFSEDGYEFEGYNVWQGAGEAGPWTKIGTFDKVNGITTIWDQVYNQTVGALIEQPVQYGTDEGLQYAFRVRKDFIKNIPLVNGKPYSFAVTGYAYNPAGVPKVLENAPVAVQGIPQRPVLDMSYQSEYGAAVDVTESGNVNDMNVSVSVVDPSAVTGDTYSVLFDTTDDGTYVWNVTNTNTGQVLVSDYDNFSGDENYLVIDGIQPVVTGPIETKGDIDFSKGYLSGYGQGYAGFDFTGTRPITGVNWGGRTFFFGGDIGENFFGSTVPNAELVTVRIDFWNATSNAADPVAAPWSDAATYDRTAGYAFNGIGTFPGAAYDISDPDNPRRLNICFNESDLVDGFWDPIAADAGDDLGGREYLFIMASDYNGAVDYDDANFGPSSDTYWAFWVKSRGASFTGEEEFTVTVYAKIEKRADIGAGFMVDTDGYQPVQSAKTAEERLDEINVYPNPYFGHNKMEGTFYTQFVTFNNLPEDECVIRVFSLSGALVTTIEHNNGTPFERWYLLNDHELPIASGMYIVHVETAFGDKILKLGIINREAYYQHL